MCVCIYIYAGFVKNQWKFFKIFFTYFFFVQTIFLFPRLNLNINWPTFPSPFGFYKSLSIIVCGFFFVVSECLVFTRSVNHKNKHRSIDQLSFNVGESILIIFHNKQSKTTSSNTSLKHHQRNNKMDTYRHNWINPQKLIMACGCWNNSEGIRQFIFKFSLKNRKMIWI